MSDIGFSEPTASFDTLESTITGPTDTTAVVVKDSLSESDADSRQRRTLRLWICVAVIALLGAELTALFMIIIWQGRGHFNLNEWAFTMITNGILLQTFFSFRTIVTHLFPGGTKDFIGKS